MFVVLRILVIAATLVAATGVDAAYTSCDASTEHGAAGDGGACNDLDCPPGVLCSLCPCGSAVLPPPAVVRVDGIQEPRVEPPRTTGSRSSPSTAVAEIFHPPRTHE